MPKPPVEPTYFRTQAEFRRWLTKHHATAAELWVGLIKKGAELEGMGYQEALDEALCFGWIDAVRISIDAQRWTIRFTQRKPNSIWSGVNIKRMEQLIAEGKVAPAGLKAYQARSESRSKVYAYEVTTLDAELTSADAKALKKSPTAWNFFEAMPKSYRRSVIHWLSSAKQEATHERRLATLIEHCEKGERLPQYDYKTWKAKKAAGAKS